jgi:hypothetical protein
MRNSPADFETLTETLSIVRIQGGEGGRKESSLPDSVIREGRMRVYVGDLLLADAPALLDEAEAFACACLFLGSAAAAPDIRAVVPHIRTSRTSSACVRVDVGLPAASALAQPWENLDAIDEASLRRAGLAPLALPETGGAALPIEAVFEAVAALSEEPSLYRRTGGVHSAGLARPDGSLVLRFEDISRRSAVDKTIGAALLEGLVAGSAVSPSLGEKAAPGESADSGESVGFLVSSGRISADFVVRAAKARFPLIASVSAPTDRAVELAELWGITLCGFVRGKRMNIYSHEERVLR